MKKTFAYNPINDEVISYSDGKNEVPEKFYQIELEVNEEEHEKLQQNYKPWIRNNILVLEKPQRIIDEEEAKRKEKAKDDLKEKLKDPKVQLKDVGNLLLELLT